MFLSCRSARLPASAYSARHSHYRPAFEALEERTLLSLGPPIVTPVGFDPRGTVVGDFNRDGKLDIATFDVSKDGSTRVVVMLGNGDGTFQAPVSYLAGQDTSSFEVGDFRGDGRLDLAFANPNQNAVGILPGNGDGTFAPARSINVGFRPENIALGDFNGDGKLDIAAISVPSSGAATVSVLLGNGDGTFQAPVNTPLTGTSPPFFGLVGTGDFNRDGHLDLVFIGAGLGGLGGNLDVLLGNGDGSFHTTPPISLGFITGITVGDFRGDGKLDLAVSVDVAVAPTFGASAVEVLLGNGDGTFGPPTVYGGFSPVAVGDFNGDGKPDIIGIVPAFGDRSGIISPASIAVLPGNGDGTFRRPVGYTVPAPSSLAVGDFNGDGKPDVVVTHSSSADLGNSVYVMLNQPADHEAYIVRVYQDLLFRNPEGGASAAWSALLDKGLSKAQFVLDVEASVEYRTNEVTNLYNMLLRRRPDSGGLNALVGFLGAGGTREQAEAIVLGSQEYFARQSGSTVAGFISSLYRDLLSRAPDLIVLSAFSQAVAAGVPRTAIASAFLNSPEYHENLAIGFYFGFLHRPPDPVGLVLFTNALQAGVPDETAIAVMMSSPEYLANL
jgi:hypothetical protein